MFNPAKTCLTWIVSVQIKVLDRPEPPESLTASVDGDKCVLMWKRSKDDGGSPIEHYQVKPGNTYSGTIRIDFLTGTGN